MPLVSDQESAIVEEFCNPRSAGLSLASLVLGIVAVCSMCVGIGGVIGIGALICGYLSRKGMRERSGALKYSRMAVAGIVMGYISIVVVLLMILGMYLFPNFGTMPGDGGTG